MFVVRRSAASGTERRLKRMLPCAARPRDFAAWHPRTRENSAEYQRDRRDRPGRCSRCNSIYCLVSTGSRNSMNRLRPSAENAAGKARHYSQFVQQPVFADDSGLVVPALGGVPGVHSARYAGPQRIRCRAYRQTAPRTARPRWFDDRSARFVCVIALAERGRVLCVFSAAAEGEILNAPRGESGFGYDPVFLFPPLNKDVRRNQPRRKESLQPPRSRPSASCKNF